MDLHGEPPFYWSDSTPGFRSHPGALRTAMRERAMIFGRAALGFQRWASCGPLGQRPLEVTDPRPRQHAGSVKRKVHALLASASLFWPSFPRATDRVVAMGFLQVPLGREVWGRADRARQPHARRAPLLPVLRQKQGAGPAPAPVGWRAADARHRPRPRVLLLDEPSAGLAPLVVGQVVDTVRALHGPRADHPARRAERGRGRRPRQRAHVLVNGEIAVSGPAGDLLTNPDVLAFYLGR